MKIRLLSDLHLEGNKFYYEYAGEDIVVLAGDIHTQGRHDWLIEQIPSNVKVIMVAGNHEYYGAVFEDVNSTIQEMENIYPNFHYLQNESLMIGDIDFFGGTMFTGLDLYGNSEEHLARASMNARMGIADFTWISRINPPPDDFDNSYAHNYDRRWTTGDHVQEFNLFKWGLEDWLKQPKTSKKVVISHFVPHPACTDPKFKNSVLNPYFITNMGEYMDKIDLWLFGHTHTSFDTVVNGCRLVCNPHGYGQENLNGFNKNLILEI